MGSEVMDDRTWRRARHVDDVPEPVYTCPLSTLGVSQHCPAPKPAPALEAAVEALGYAAVGLPWGAPREATTEAVRGIAVETHAAKNHAEAWRAAGKGW